MRITFVQKAVCGGVGGIFFQHEEPMVCLIVAGQVVETEAGEGTIAWHCSKLNFKRIAICEVNNTEPEHVG